VKNLQSELTENQNDQVMTQTAESEREKNIIILITSIVMILLLIIITVESIIICKFKSENSAKKEEIIRLNVKKLNDYTLLW
jgi:hypothetical protein